MLEQKKYASSNPGRPILVVCMSIILRSTRSSLLSDENLKKNSDVLVEMKKIDKVGSEKQTSAAFRPGIKVWYLDLCYSNTRMSWVFFLEVLRSLINLIIFGQKITENVKINKKRLKLQESILTNFQVSAAPKSWSKYPTHEMAYYLISKNVIFRYGHISDVGCSDLHCIRSCSKYLNKKLLYQASPCIMTLSFELLFKSELILSPRLF